MKWKVEVLGDSPSEETVQLLTRRTDLPLDSILLTFSRNRVVTCGGLSESEAQEIADSLKRDRGVSCKVLPDSEKAPEPVQLYRVLLVNYRPGYRTRLRRKLQEMTRLPQEQVIGWLSRMPFALSKGVDSEAARRIKKAVTESGGIVRIETETPIQENLTARRKSTAVFRPRTPSEPEKDDSDNLFSRQEPEAVADGGSEIPPVTGLPEGATVEPPPLDRIDTAGGPVSMHPPPRFAAGVPAVCLADGFALEPPILADPHADGIPDPVVFDPPPAQSTDPPPVVGTRASTSWAAEPAPEISLLYPPPSSLDLSMLLPPMLGVEAIDTESAPDHPAGGPAAGYSSDVTSEPLPAGDAAGTEKVPAGATGRTFEDAADAILSEFRVLTGGPLRLFLCRPSPENEDTVVEALRDVLGVSVRDSWDLLRKAPTLLREYSDHTSAILTVHQLESRGVTVSLSRSTPEDRRSDGISGEGLRAWLTGNG